MSSPQLVERSSLLIKNYIIANIDAALAQVRNDRPDALVGTSTPQAYFFFETANAYRTPAIFIIADNIDFRKTVQGANHISAMTTYKISVVVEDRAEEYLTTKAWRYQAALHLVLDQTEITDVPDNVKIVIVVTQASFSPTFTSAGTQPNNFRKEILLNCEVYHYENF